MTLSIIIVNWNTRDLLSACLNSVQAETARLPNYGVETFVVDNASSDGSADYIQQTFPWVRLIRNEANLGFAQANNQAIRQAAGQYILLLNSDTELLPGALRTLLAFMDNREQAAAVAARLLNSDGSLQISCHPMLTPEREFWRLAFLDRLWPRASYPMRRWNTTQPRQVESMMGACMLLRRDALDEVGLLDDGYFMYTEEVDLCYRLRQTGWELWWVPQAQVIHYGGASSRQAYAAMYVALYRSKTQFYRKFGGHWRARRFKLLLALAYLPRVVVTTLVGLVWSRGRESARFYRYFLAQIPGF